MMLQSHVSEAHLTDPWEKHWNMRPNDLAAVVRVALKTVLPARNVAYVFDPDGPLILLGTGRYLLLSSSLSF